MKFEPLVSIVIPVYNGSNYVKEAIDSALEQTYKNKEILVINDGSTDDGATRSIAESYGDKIRYIEKENGGVSSALNTGIANMRGEYFSWLSHDDVYTPDKLEVEVKALSTLDNKDALVYCADMQIDKDSKPLSAVQGPPKLTPHKLNPWNSVLKLLLVEGTLNGCAFLIPKKIFDVCGGFDETLRYNQDSFMWYKIFMEKYPLYYVPKVCVKNRVHDKQLTQTGRSIFRHDCLAMSEYLIPKFTEISTKEDNFIYGYMLYNAKYGNREVVANSMKAAKAAGLANASDSLKIRSMQAYGTVRPIIRKAYYRLVKHTKTK